MKTNPLTSVLPAAALLSIDIEAIGNLAAAGLRADDEGARIALGEIAVLAGIARTLAEAVKA